MPVALRDETIQNAVQTWGRRTLRDLPWRQIRDPWAILVSETMLQQTQVARVVDRLPRFLERFPTVEACAASAPGDVVDEWAGLGYNRRPLNLHRAAVAMVERHGGRVPERLDDLLALPGIGPYTARAVRAFAFEAPAAVVDTNIGRLLARLEGRTLRPREVQELADELLTDEVWLWNQSVMELGALVCTKRAPRCDECPVADPCSWRGTGADPAVGSAAVSKPQARFEGSDRQLRGRLVDAMRSAPVALAAVAGVVGSDDEPRVDRIVAGLERDGLAVLDGEVLRLP